MLGDAVIWHRYNFGQCLVSLPQLILCVGCVRPRMSEPCFPWQCLSCFVFVWPGTARPPYWQKPVYLLDEEDERNNGFVNDDFIIWMRVSAFATFRNLYRRIRRVRPFAEGLPAGNYTFHIAYSILSDPPRLPESYKVGKWIGSAWAAGRDSMESHPVSAEPSEGFGPCPGSSCALTPGSGNAAG